MIGFTNQLWATSHHRLRWFWIAAIIGLAAPWSCDRVGDFGLANSAQSCTVNSIHDGDTMRLTCDGERIKVRLYCIDAPELAQKPWGRESRDHLRAITPQTVQLIRRDKDRYGRIVGEVIATTDDQQVNLNLEMVRSGQAALYRKYCREPRFREAHYQAQQAKAGIWSKPGLQQTPWEYRHN